jgi:hypothetical protein
MAKTIPLGSAVYVRYLDHLLYRNVEKPILNPDERETVGWILHEDKKGICVVWDRTKGKTEYFENCLQSGCVILKECILEMRPLPLQKLSGRSLSCWNPKESITECAFQTEKRKTQPRNKRTGANK